jgi:hypothetical protein
MSLSMTDSTVENSSFVLGTASAGATGFVERRAQREPYSGPERRQFTNSYSELSPAARELAMAIDAFKLGHHRRFINFEEMLHVIESLGYRKT